VDLTGLLVDERVDAEGLVRGEGDVHRGRGLKRGLRRERPDPIKTNFRLTWRVLANSEPYFFNLRGDNLH